MSVYAIIPARSGSKGVPHKNIRMLGGHPLLGWSIAAARLCPQVDRIIVTTDSEEYAAIARRYGAETPFLRPAHLATDKSRDRDFFIHALNFFAEHENRLPETLMFLRPTTPFRVPAVLSGAVEKFASRPECTSLCSAFELPESPAKNFKLLPDDTFAGFIGNAYLDAPRQECPKGFVWDGHVDLLRTEHVLHNESLYGDRRCAFITEPNIEIDTLEEFERAEYLFQLKKEQYKELLLELEKA